MRTSTASASIAGEYRFRQPSYDFGIYLGLGGYELAGDDFFEGEVDDRGLGLALGFTGDFDLTRRLSVVVELLNLRLRRRSAPIQLRKQGPGE